MGIRGLTDRGGGFAQIGNIRKGMTVEGKGGVTRPTDLKYFRVEFDEMEQERAAKFKQIYGDKPTEINILLPFNDLERVWDAWCEAYTAGRMVARSDGEFFSYLVDPKTGEQLVTNGVGKDGNPVPHKTELGVIGKTMVKCKPVGRLKVIVPELQSLAYLVVHTTSYIDIRNISEQLEGIKLLNNDQIVGIPLVLRRRPKKISVPKPDGTKARMEKWMISIEADPRWVASKITNLQNAALPNGLGAKYLAEKVDEVLTVDYIEEGDFDDEVMEPEGNEEAVPTEAEVRAIWVHESQPGDPEPMFSDHKQVQEPLRYDPKLLKERISQVANTSGRKKAATADDRKQVMACLEEALLITGSNVKDNRKQLLNWLTGFESPDYMPDDYVIALHTWLKPKQDSGGMWAADPMSAREALAALNAAQPLQERLPL
jgi:hypothetical protein